MSRERLFRFFRRHYRRLVAMKRGPRFALGDLVDAKGSWGKEEILYTAIMNKKFVHRSLSREIVNCWMYQVDGSDSWYKEERLKRIKTEVEEDMTVCNG